MRSNKYQCADNGCRGAWDGGVGAKWTEAWAHIHRGKIVDSSGQRERAANEYNRASRTRDNSQGAQEEAAKYLKAPYERKRGLS